MSSLTIPTLNPEQKRQRKETLGRIERLLSVLDHPHWRGVVLNWLNIYSGLENYLLWPSEDPVTQVQVLLQGYIDRGEKLVAEVFASDLTALPFVAIAARLAAGGPRWNPLTDSFDSWACGELVNLWEASFPGSVRDAMQSKLLALLRRTSNAIELD